MQNDSFDLNYKIELVKLGYMPNRNKERVVILSKICIFPVNKF